MEYSVINKLQNLTNESYKPYLTLYKLVRIPKSSCQYVMEIPYENRCAFIYDTHDCAVSSAPFVNTFDWVFCVFPEEWSFIGIIATFISLFLLFFVTTILADLFICPNLAVVTETLHLPESLAGVTILAFGNGAPDLFAAYAGAETDHSEMMFASLTGSGLFVTTLVSGIILFIRPFKVDKLSLLRNVFFYLCCYSILYVCFYYRYYTIYHALCILGVYAIYLFINIMHVVADNMIMKSEGLQITDDETKLASMAMERSLFIPSISGRETVTIGTLRRMETKRIYSLMGFKLAAPIYRKGYNWRHLRPFIAEFIQELSIRKFIGPDPSWLSIMMLVIEVPLLFILKMVVPVVNMEERNDGWCKLLVMINLFLLPNLVFFCFDYEGYVVSYGEMSIPLGVVGVLVGLCLATIIFFTTQTFAKPRFHKVIAYLGFFCAIAIIRFVSAQLIFHLTTIGARFTISSSILSVTLLSWGNCLVDCVSNTAIAKRGLQNMGFAACFGGPMFNCSLGVGLISIIVYLKGTPVKAFYGHVAPVGSLFMFISLISTVVFVPCLNFEGRRCFGLYLIMLYFTFCIFCILMEDTIHSFGTQYFKDRATAISFQ